MIRRVNWNPAANKQIVRLSQIREINVDRASGPVTLKYDEDSENHVLVCGGATGGVDLQTYILPQAHDTKLPLSVNKTRNLRGLMSEKAIPGRYHTFYERLCSVH